MRYKRNSPEEIHKNLYPREAKRYHDVPVATCDVATSAEVIQMFDTFGGTKQGTQLKKYTLMMFVRTYYWKSLWNLKTHAYTLAKG